MKICLTKEAIEKAGLTIGEALYLLILSNDVNPHETLESLLRKGLIGKKYNDMFSQDGYFMTNNAKALLEGIIVDSDSHQEPIEEMELLATKLKEVFPKGKKDGTNLYWTDGIALIIRRLKLFFKKYGNSYTHDQIIDAATRYVKGFNGQYRYMQLLKYFIFKEKIGAANEVEGESQLMNFVENGSQENEIKDDWTSTLK